MGKRNPKFIRLPPAGTFPVLWWMGRGRRYTESKLEIKGLYPGSTRVKSLVPHGLWRDRFEASLAVGLGGKRPRHRSKLEVDTHCVGWWVSSMRGQGRQGMLGVPLKESLVHHRFSLPSTLRGTLEPEV